MMIRCNAVWSILLGVSVALSAPAAVAQGATGSQAAAQADAKADVKPEADTRLFAVEIRTGPKWDPALPPPQQAYFKEHSANLRQLREAGRLVLGARYSDKGLVILSAASADEARALMNQDPAITHGTFVYELHEFNVFYAGNVPARPRR